MTDQQLDRLVCFFYLLTRGTPDVPGMGWGDVKTILREGLAPFGSQHDSRQVVGRGGLLVRRCLTCQQFVHDFAGERFAGRRRVDVDADTIDKMISE